MNTKLLALSIALALGSTAAVAAPGAPPGDLGAQYAFPQGLKMYDAGTTVSNKGRKYECKEFPWSGFCGQWSPGSNEYEPGVGFAWKEAWIDITPPAPEGEDYHFDFPDYFGIYGPRVKVSHGGNTYECKPYPFGGFCKQWSPSDTQHEPGVGFAWKQAWELLGPSGEKLPSKI